MKTPAKTLTKTTKTPAKHDSTIIKIADDIAYPIKLTRKNIKRIIIKIHPTSIVCISAPYSVSLERISAIVRAKSHWIDHHLARTKSAQTPTSAYFLGKQYRIKLDPSAKSAHIADDCIVLAPKAAADDGVSGVCELLDEFYAMRARDILEPMVRDLSRRVGKDIARLKVRKMTTRWGSCNSAKSYINLSTELVKKPVQAIEAVIMHELAHLYHANHSREFYATLLSFLPDYHERIKLLSQPPIATK